MANEEINLKTHPLAWRRWIGIGACLISAHLSCGAQVVNPNPPGSNDAPRGLISPSASWHDGKQTRGLWIDPAREAEFPSPTGIGPTEAGAAITGMGSGSAGSRPAGAGATLRPKDLASSGQALRSPLFFDNPSLNGTPRALPGGVLVELKTPADPDSARQQLQSDGLSPVRAIVANRIWLVASPPGLAALELANRLQQSGHYASAQPNWWQPRIPK
jgi:hypothetical protein